MQTNPPPVGQLQAQAEASASSSLAQRADAQRKRQSDEAALCADTRPARAKNAIKSAKLETDLIVKVLQRCKLTLTKTGAVTVQRSGSGSRIAPEMREGVSCPTGLPAGVTQEQAAIVVSQTQPGAIRPTVAELADDDANRTCQGLDRAAGLDLHVLSTDLPALTKISEWKPVEQ
jgi:hypothetical protein